MNVLPDDDLDRELVAHVHPPDWVNPTPDGRYNLVVIGGGPAGLVAAFGAAGIGAKVALVERYLLGGDCLNWGCVPSKALLAPAHIASAARHAEEFGLTADVTADFEAVMQRMRAIRARIAPHDSATRLRDAGIDVFLGDATFSGPDAVRVGETELRFARACVATGARASLPPIPGLSDAGAMTNEELFTLTDLPPRLTIVGAGVIGCEMAQAFASFGSAVTVIDMADRVLPREEPEASALVAAALEQVGATLVLGADIEAVSRDGDLRVVALKDGTRVESEALLVAAGRRPNVDMNLEAAGVRYDARGVSVDDHLRTSNPRIFAAGDVAGRAQFTHAADHQARIVVRNALLFGRARESELVVPRVTYTRPEVAAVGISQAEAEADPDVTTWTVRMDDTDRGRTDGATGYMRVFADGKGAIKGATVVDEQAGELLAPITLAMTQGISLAAIASTIHPYPTRSEALFKIASDYNRGRLAPWMTSVLQFVLKRRR